MVTICGPSFGHVPKLERWKDAADYIKQTAETKYLREGKYNIKICSSNINNLLMFYFKGRSSNEILKG